MSTLSTWISSVEERNVLFKHLMHLFCGQEVPEETLEAIDQELDLTRRGVQLQDVAKWWRKYDAGLLYDATTIAYEKYYNAESFIHWDTLIARKCRYMGMHDACQRYTRREVIAEEFEKIRPKTQRIMIKIARNSLVRKQWSIPR
ncbi:hypothetical protein FRB91_000367 [Serendipita sp. 411]|nr:hypothetical protein FRC18_000319 [Serendipita sp. 400]KAG8846909.1 hypothetical protein FRB91_000367 [Serendipita sp. 411]